MDNSIIEDGEIKGIFRLVKKDKKPANKMDLQKKLFINGMAFLNSKIKRKK